VVRRDALPDGIRRLDCDELDRPDLLVTGVDVGGSRP
jgi:hypothetical protein